MIIKIIGDKEFIVDQKRGEQIARGLQRNKDSWVELGGGMVKAHQIVSIMPGGQVEADRPRIDTSRQLKADGRSEQQRYSSARRASEIARDKLTKMGILKPKEETSL